MCMESRTFFLLEAPLGVSGRWLVKGVTCEKCGYEAVATDDGEREKLARASTIWKSRTEGKFTPVVADELLQKLDSEVLARIRKEGRRWSCPSCGEKNAMSFGECWKCQREREVTVKMTMFASEAELLAVLDRADATIAAGVDGTLDFRSFHQQLYDLYGYHALDGHESDEGERGVLARHGARIAWIERVLHEVGGLCADDDAIKEAYIKAGRFGTEEALRRLRALVEKRNTEVR